MELVQEATGYTGKKTLQGVYDHSESSRQFCTNTRNGPGNKSSLKLIIKDELP